MRIIFKHPFPAAERSSLRALLRRWGKKIPGLEEINCEVKDLKGGGLETLPEPEYRRTKIRFSAQFFTMKASDREVFLVHELAHYITHPLTALALTLADDNDAVKEAIRQMNEAATEDISIALGRLDKERQRR